MTWIYVHSLPCACVCELTVQMEAPVTNTGLKDKEKSPRELTEKEVTRDPSSRTLRCQKTRQTVTPLSANRETEARSCTLQGCKRIQRHNDSGLLQYRYCTDNAPISDGNVISHMYGKSWLTFC